ncbi:CAP domain-containing protein [Gamsiella multidivaricata]|uniref:CAP domain-containing protein n=1 Tax=Gamsiella multidivaricata TaxID=101098 RepID=UPI00221F9D3C|nr:CAP domain-containing protein [Gamsiella multidivaricata]KAI7821198.1 CAP domain-containing protein [Gamsiella multidivaricata]
MLKMINISSLFLVGLAFLSVHTPSVSADAWSDQVLAEHNQARARYGARALQWTPALYSATVQYVQMCKFAHSNAESQYGENIYASSNPNTGIKDAVAAWMAESSNYNYNNPGFSAATGQFTQVVWKNTQQVTCAMASCPAGAIFPQPSKYIVCRYTPQGNIAGQFPQNVGRSVV